MSSFLFTLCIPLSAFFVLSLIFPVYMYVCVRMYVCEFMLHKDQNKGFTSTVGTFWLVLMGLFAVSDCKPTHHLQKC